MLPGGERLALLHDPDSAGIILAEKLADHHGRFFAANDLRLRMAQQQLRKRCGMIRFHMLHNHIFQRTPGQHMGQILKKHPADGLVDRIEQNGLLIQKQIRVVGDALRHRIDAFEHG